MPVIHLSEKEFSEKVVNIETISSQWKYKGDKPALIDFFCNMVRSVQGFESYS